MRLLIGLLFCLVSQAHLSAADNLVTNGGFESGLRGWRSLWTRQPGAGTVSEDRQMPHTGSGAARIEHRGTNDWSFEPEQRLSVRPGDLFELEVWARLQGSGSLSLCVSTWDARGQNLSWSYGQRTTYATQNWKRLRTRVLVPAGVAQIQARLIGNGPSTVWVDDYALRPQALQRGLLPDLVELTNTALTVSFRPADATMSVLDRRTNRRWSQRAISEEVMVMAANARERRIDFEAIHVPSGLGLHGSLQLDPVQPELAVRFVGDGELPGAIRFPYPFTSEPADRLIVPMNEGISYPVEDPSIEPFRLAAYAGHGGLSMAFWGVVDDATGQGYQAIIESPDDAAVRLQRVDNRMVIAPEWDPQRGQFGYERKLRYIFFAQGGHVAVAKQYRQYARETGLLKTLAAKRQENPNVDLLIGAANVWNWDADPVELVKEMQAAGIQRILWSRGGSAEAMRSLNQMNVLTSSYDIYQDVMDPANFTNLWVYDKWTSAAWPQDIILRWDGQWQHGWGERGKNGVWYDCGVLCDRQALTYARQRIPAELATHPYRCRFIDTTTATPWNECYNTNHPMTRTESRLWKMKLLECVSRDFKLVTGCETGHDAAVPFLHYFEGMLSLCPYRVPDAGRDMQRIWDNVPEQVAKFQLGHAYRLPLWELVYHDCVVAQWYWGDYNNKLPALWDKRDRFNLLYGTPPMFMFNRNLWQSEKERFVRSYQETCPYVREVGYAEMTDHRFLTSNRDVQQTTFANGVSVTVNFGTTPFTLPSGKVLPPLGFLVAGMPPDSR